MDSNFTSLLSHLCHQHIYLANGTNFTKYDQECIDKLQASFMQSCLQLHTIMCKVKNHVSAPTHETVITSIYDDRIIVPIVVVSVLGFFGFICFAGWLIYWILKRRQQQQECPLNKIVV
jgi:hypothetical protein